MRVARQPHTFIFIYYRIALGVLLIVLLVDRRTSRDRMIGSRVTTVLLVRHGLTAMTGPVLAGRTPGVHLDERGPGAGRRGWRERLAACRSPRSSPARWSAAVETADVVRAGPGAETPRGTSTTGSSSAATATGPAGRSRTSAKDPLWKVVQAHPSRGALPGRRRVDAREMQTRAVGAVRDWDARLGADAIWVACSHGDVIKAIVADALGPAPRPVPAHRRSTRARCR